MYGDNNDDALVVMVMMRMSTVYCTTLQLKDQAQKHVL